MNVLFFSFPFKKLWPLFTSYIIAAHAQAAVLKLVAAVLKLGNSISDGLSKRFELRFYFLLRAKLFSFIKVNL